MADGIKITRDFVRPRLALLTGNINQALATGMQITTKAATNAMANRVESATTRTGIARAAGEAYPYPWRPRPAWYAGRGPGRIESGKILGSITTIVQRTNTGYKGRAGFIDAPSYLEDQEKGTPSRSGRAGIPAMGAYAMGNTVFNSIFEPTMSREAANAIQLANQGRVLRRSRG